jgi:hypothetical protein
MAGRPSAQRAGLLQSNNKAVQDDYEGKLLALQKQHEAKQLAMKNEHQAALTQLQRDHEANVADQIKAVEKVAEARMQEVERQHNEAQMLEKQDLEEKISAAEAERDGAVRQLTEANRAAQEWKEKFELAQEQAKKLQQVAMPQQDDDEMSQPYEYHASKLSSFTQQPPKSGHGFYGTASRMEMHSATKVPVYFGEPSRAHTPKRSINRAQPVRPQSQDSMLFQDEVEEEEDDEQQDEDVDPEPLPRPSQVIQPAPQGPDHFRSDARQKERNEYDFILSSPPSNGTLSRRGADVLAGARSEEPRANSSQRMVPSTDVRSRLEGASKMTGAKEAGTAANGRVLRSMTVSDVVHITCIANKTDIEQNANIPTTKNGSSHKTTAQATKKQPRDASKVLVKNSQDESRKRTSSPLHQSNAGKRKRVNGPEQGKVNAFTQHNTLQRTRSREGLVGPPSRPGTGASLAAPAFPTKRINSKPSGRVLSATMKTAKARSRVSAASKKATKIKGA